MKQFFTKKRIIYLSIALVVLAGVGFLFVSNSRSNKGTLTQKVVKGDLMRTVLATGQVTSSTDLDLSFKTPGLVENVYVKVGDKVEDGDILATLTQRDEDARITQAQAALKSAQASYDKLIAGADTPAVNIAKSAFASAETANRNALASFNTSKYQQDGLVRNAQLALFNNDLEAKRSKIVTGEVTATISGAYKGDVEGKYRFQVEFIGSGFKVTYSGIETGTSTVNMKRGIPTPLGTKGLYVTFSTDGSFSGTPVWEVNIPNIESTSYITYFNSYNSAVQTRDSAMISAENNLNSTEAALEQARFNLSQTLAAARPEDVAIAEAQIMSAEGQLEAAMAAYENTVIRAPANGTITAVEIAEGEQSPTGKASIVLKDLENLYVEANIAEANISEIKQGQEVKITFDAIGSDKIFTGKMATVDPASTLVSGIVNYKIKAQLDKLPEIKPGMTANLTIVIESKSNVLSVPERSIIEKDGQRVVRVVTNEKTKDFIEQAVVTGMKGDGGMIEVVSGLTPDLEIITDTKKK